MKIDEQTEKKKYENVLPLINIVFLLLIFFMVAGTLSRRDFYEVKVPEVNTENAIDQERLTIVMNTQGQLAVNDKAYTEPELVVFLQTHLVTNKQETTVHLKADAQAQSSHLLKVMELLSSAGVESLRLFTVAENN